MNRNYGIFVLHSTRNVNIWPWAMKMAKYTYGIWMSRTCRSDDPC